MSLLALLGISAPISGAADGVMRIAFPSDYLVAAPALSILVFGMVGFALFVVASTALTGTGRPWLAAAIAWIVFAITVVANRWLLLKAGIRIDSLAAAATATSLSTAVAVALIGGVLFVTLRTFLPLMSLVRGLIATGLAFTASHFIPHASVISALLALIAGFIVYVAALFLSRELRMEEIQRLIHIARGR